jgi:tetratricopeptide (TPR) repeat protein
MKHTALIALFLIVSVFHCPALTSSLQGDRDQLFITASEQFRQGEYAGCYRAIETWLRETNNPLFREEALFIQAASAFELNRRDAGSLLFEFLAAHPSSPYTDKVQFMLGSLALYARQYSDALIFFRQCSESSLSRQEQTDLHFRYAYVALQTGDTIKARLLFESLAKGSSRYAASADFFLGYLAYQAGDTQAASRRFVHHTDNSQLGSLLPIYQVQLLYADGNLSEAIQTAEQLLDSIHNPLFQNELLRILAAACFDQKEYQKSWSYYTQYLTRQPNWHPTDQYRLGILYYIRDDIDSAEDLLTEMAGQENAIGQSAYYHLGLCYLKEKQYDQARMCFEQASLRDYDRDTKEKALYNYALICYETSYNGFNEPVKAFQRFLDEFPQSELADKANAYLAEVLLLTKDYRHSLAALEKVTRPDNQLLKTKAKLLFLLGVNTLTEGQGDSAVYLFNQALDLMQTLSLPKGELLYWKAEAYYRSGNYKKACSDYEACLAEKGADTLKALPAALYGAGYSYFQLKQYTQAQVALNGLFASQVLPMIVDPQMP